MHTTRSPRAARPATVETTQSKEMTSVEALQREWMAGKQPHEHHRQMQEGMRRLADRLARVQSWGGDYVDVDFSKEVQSFLAGTGASRCSPTSG